MTQSNPNSLRTFSLVVAGIAGICGLCPAAVVDPGYSLSTYASAASPVRLGFGSNGTLYAGNAASSGSITAIPANGGTGVPFGPAISDPDTVAFVPANSQIGLAGQVLVGGNTGPTTGTIRSINPASPATSSVFYSNSNTTGLVNAGEARFNSVGRLVVNEVGYVATAGARAARLYVSNGTALLSTYSSSTVEFVSLAIGTADVIYLSTRGAGNAILRFLANGTLDNTWSFALPEEAVLAMSPTAFGGDLFYAYGTPANPRVFRLNTSTLVNTEIVSGTGHIGGLEIGPDSGLYISDITNNSVYRLQAIPEPMILSMLVPLLGVALRRGSGKLI